MSQFPFSSGFLRSVPILTACLLSFFALAQGEPTRIETHALPVRELVVTTSGVATFVHEGTVTGTTEWILRVPSDAMDDLLQSLVVEDFDGGVVRAVQYEARDALDRRLASYAFDLRAVQSLADVLHQARGAVVTLTASDTHRGVVTTVERDASDVGEAWFVTLVTEAGLQRFALASVTTLQFDDLGLQAELDAALAAIAEDRASDAARVHVRFEGEGERRVRVQYLRSMPVWKPTYRLVVAEEGTASLQGWAILDNPTDLDMEDVDLTLLAGAPVAFRTALFEPRYVDREVVAPTVTGTGRPETDEGSFADASLEAPGGMALRSAAPSLLGTGTDATATGSATASAFAFTVRDPVDVMRQSSIMVPIVTERITAHRVTVVDVGNEPWRAVWLRNTSDVLLPAGTVTLYGETGFEGNALSSTLPAGATRWLGFAGDLGVRVSREVTQPTQTVERAYLEGGMLVREVRERSVTNVRVARDDDEARVLVVEVPLQAGWTIVKPSGPAPLQSDAAWRFGVQLDGAGGAEPESIPDLPVQVRCAMTDPCTFDVMLERLTERSLLVQNVSSDDLAVLLRNDTWSRADRAALEEVLAAQRDLANLEARLSTVRQERETLAGEQARIRENMAVLDQESPLYRRYVADLTSLEDSLQETRSVLTSLEASVREAQARLSDAIRALTAR